MHQVRAQGHSNQPYLQEQIAECVSSWKTHQSLSQPEFVRRKLGLMSFVVYGATKGNASDPIAQRETTKNNITPATRTSDEFYGTRQNK